MKPIAHVGEYYTYWGCSKKFRLVSVNRWVYVFECGHRCTDSIFSGLIRAKTGVSVYNEIQLTLF